MHGLVGKKTEKTYLKIDCAVPLFWIKVLKIWRGHGTSLVVQWLGLHASTTGDSGSIPGRGTKITSACWASQRFQCWHFF